MASFGTAKMLNKASSDGVWRKAKESFSSSLNNGLINRFGTGL